MSENNQDLELYIDELLEELRTSNRVHSSDIPNIDLYMDQITTFMDDHLGVLKRGNEDKILTKTMINNYSKSKILPPTVKKKYTKDHIILMLFIYYLKPVLSIADIKTLLDPIKVIAEKDPNFSLENLHDMFTEIEKSHFKLFEEQTKNTIAIASDLFEDVKNPAKQEMLSLFGSAYLLSLQASAQKYMITKLIDEYIHKFQDGKNKDK